MQYRTNKKDILIENSNENVITRIISSVHNSGATA